jgi:glycosyltransferase involved in cell wall biosynthesis
MDRGRHAALALPCGRGRDRAIAIYEPFGLVALEALASGCVCVVAETGGLREVVPEGGSVGLRFPSRDAAALGEVLEQVLTDDAVRAQVVAEAREHVVQFGWQEVARRTRDVYAALAPIATLGDPDGSNVRRDRVGQ